MNMIIDMRLRPPTKSWISKPQFKQGVPFYPSQVGFLRPPSAEERSMELLLSEMDTAGVTWGVSMGRRSASSRMRSCASLSIDIPSASSPLPASTCARDLMKWLQKLLDASLGLASSECR
jgi:hypothetical protein